MIEEAEAKRLGEILVEHGMLTEADIEEALQIQSREGGLLGRILVNRGFVSQDDVVSALVKQCRIPHIRLKTVSPHPTEALELVPQSLARQHRLVPIDKKDDVLSVAMEDPRDLDIHCRSLQAKGYSEGAC